MVSFVTISLFDFISLQLILQAKTFQVCIYIFKSGNIQYIILTKRYSLLHLKESLMCPLIISIITIVNILTIVI